jgi:hypothetical protein
MIIRQKDDERAETYSLLYQYRKTRKSEITNVHQVRVHV